MSHPRRPRTCPRAFAAALAVAVVGLGVSGAALAGAPEPPPATAPGPPPAAPINMEFRDTDLPTVLRAICQGAGLDFVLDPTVQGKVTAKLRNTTWETALDIVLKSHGLASKREGKTLLISPVKAEPGAPGADQRRVAVAARPDGKFDLDAGGADIRDALRELATVAKRNLVASKDLTGTVTASLHDLKADELLAALADSCNATVTQKGNITLFGPRVAAGPPGGPGAPPGPEPKAAAPVEVRRLPDGRLAIHAREAPVREVLSHLATAAGLNLVVSPQLAGTLSLDLEGVAAQDALDVLAAQANLTLRPAGGILYVAPAPATLQTETFRLRSAKAKEIGDALTQSVPGLKIAIETSNNLLIVTGPAEALATARQIVQQVEIAPIQVTIETRIVETNLTGDEKLGVEWMKNFAVNLTSAKIPTAFPFSRNTNCSLTPAYDPSSTRTNGDSSVPFAKPEDFQFGFLSTSALNIVLNFLQEKTKARLIACPLVTTVDNQKARISNVTKFPIATYQVSSETGLLTVSGFEYKEYGTILEVTPRVSDGHILLDVKPEISRPSGTTTFQGAELPIISSQETQTQVRIKDGDTLVIAGLIREETEHKRGCVPLLGDLPLVGGLFRWRRNNVSERRNLLIFITPHIVGPADFSRSAQLRRERTEPLPPTEDGFDR